METTMARLTNDDREVLRRALDALVDREKRNLLEFAARHMTIPGAEGYKDTPFAGTWEDLVEVLGDDGGLLPMFRAFEKQVNAIRAKIRNAKSGRKPKPAGD